MSREALLLVEKSTHCISWYDWISGERLRTLPLPDFPHEFVTDSSGQRAWVGHYGVETSGHKGEGGHTLLQINIQSGVLERSIDLSPYNRIHGLQMDAQDRLYALSEAQAKLLVLPNPATDDDARRAVCSGGIKSHLFALTRDGQTAYCMNLLSHTVTRVRPWEPLVSTLACAPGDKPEGCALSADERTLYVSCRWSNTLCAIDAETMQVRLTAASREDVTRLYLHRTGRLFCSNYGDRSMSVLDPGTLQETACVPLSARAIALSFHPTLPLAFISQDDDHVAVLDTDTLKVRHTIHTQREPDVSAIVTLGAT
ncbi:MAG: YncE family protein [Herbaspirillum sp.]